MDEIFSFASLLTRIINGYIVRNVLKITLTFLLLYKIDLKNIIVIIIIII